MTSRKPWARYRSWAAKFECAPRARRGGAAPARLVEQPAQEEGPHAAPLVFGRDREVAEVELLGQGPGHEVAGELAAVAHHAGHRLGRLHLLLEEAARPGIAGTRCARSRARGPGPRRVERRDRKLVPERAVGRARVHGLRAPDVERTQSRGAGVGRDFLALPSRSGASDCATFPPRRHAGLGAPGVVTEPGTLLPRWRGHAEPPAPRHDARAPGTEAERFLGALGEASRVADRGAAQEREPSPRDRCGRAA